jgi:MFS family permease
VLRIAGGTSGILIGLYLAMLSNAGAPIGAGIVGTLGAVSLAAELVAAIPMGVAADASQPRLLMTSGALLGGAAALLFGLSGWPPIFYVSRTLEGIGAAAVVPALLAYLADATDAKPALRVRAMSYFELTLLAGLALGGVIAAQLFHLLHSGAFAVIAFAYVACAVTFLVWASPRSVRRIRNPLRALFDVLGMPSIRRLAPVWLCVNAVVGLWLGPMLPYLLTSRAVGGQYLPGLFVHDSTRVGWLLLGYAAVFGTGIATWSVVLPRIRLAVAMRVTLGAMVPVCAGLYLLNHSADQSATTRWIVGGLTAALIMVESGFTPAALAWLAQSLPVEAGRGAAMGIYSVLLSLGAIVGSLLAGVLGGRSAFDGLLLGTVLIAAVALIFLRAVWAAPQPRRRVA